MRAGRCWRNGAFWASTAGVSFARYGSCSITVRAPRSRPGWAGAILRSQWNAIAFDGVAAVILFFVISGLVTHYPYARGEQLHLWREQLSVNLYTTKPACSNRRGSGHQAWAKSQYNFRARL